VGNSVEGLKEEFTITCKLHIVCNVHLTQKVDLGGMLLIFPSQWGWIGLTLPYI